MKSAGAGLNLFAVLHQADKIIKELLAMAKAGKLPRQIADKINILNQLIESYGIIIRKTDIKIQNLNKVLLLCVDISAFRINLHHISVIQGQNMNSMEHYSKCSTNHIVNAFLNILDNAIWWMEYSKQTKYT